MATTNSTARTLLQQMDAGEDVTIRNQIAAFDRYALAATLPIAEPQQLGLFDPEIAQ